MNKGKLLVSIRGPVEAVAAAKGGAKIADVEYPASALGTPYPLNIMATRRALDANGFKKVRVSTNIGEVQAVRASACQAALGVATAGADLVKFGLAGQAPKAAAYLAKSIVRTVRELGPRGTKLYPAVFVDRDMQRFFNPFKDSPELARDSGADGILIDTFNKLIGKGLLDYCDPEDIEGFAKAMHKIGKEAWIAGSLTLEDLPSLWKTGVDVICVRGAACEGVSGKGRFAKVTAKQVAELVKAK